jgi:hypothetical protein
MVVRAALALALSACTLPDVRFTASDGATADTPTCQGDACQQACEGGTTTSVSGIVYAPNGTLPIPNATVFVPSGPLPPRSAPASCDRCAPPAGAVVTTSSDAAGQFRLTDVPPGTNVRIAFQIGRWRREVVIPTVAKCSDTRLDGQVTRLPRNAAEGDLPHIAITTGTGDALECLLRKLGVDAAAFTSDAGGGDIHLFAGAGGTTALATGGSLGPAATLWSDARLGAYDMVMINCEATAQPHTAAELQALTGYADRGGRVFLTHLSNVWIAGSPELSTIATFGMSQNLGPGTDLIDTTSPRGAALRAWSTAIGASTGNGQFALNQVWQTTTVLDTANATRFTYRATGAQQFQVTVPLAQPEGQRCGRVTFSDIEVDDSSISSPTVAFPAGCSVAPLMPQEQILAFLVFEAGTCMP